MTGESPSSSAVGEDYRPLLHVRTAGAEEAELKMSRGHLMEERCGGQQQRRP